MFIFQKIFSHKSTSQTQKPSKGLYIYLDNQLKRKIQTHNQTAIQYMNQNQFDPDQFLYLLLKNKKNDEIYSKRKINSYEWFTDCLEGIPEEYKGYIVMGYTNERNSSFPRISSNMPLSDNPKCIRSGNLQLYSDTKNSFEQCALRLHHDYLTYYKIKAKQKKVSFMGLENCTVQTVSENKYVFIVKDKFKNLVFKTTSREDMIGWLLSINQAIKIRSSQIYLNQFDQKLSKSIKQKMTTYHNKCLSLKQQSSKVILLDQIGRKALKNYMHKHRSTTQQIDIKFLSIIQNYLQMCRIRRQKGDSYCQIIISSIKQSIKQVLTSLPPDSQIIKNRSCQLSSNHQFIKIIQQIMKYLDTKYKKQIIDKKYLNYTFQHHLCDQYKKKSNIPMKSLSGNVQVNNDKENNQDIEKNNSFYINSSFSRSELGGSPVKKLNQSLQSIKNNNTNTK